MESAERSSFEVANSLIGEEVVLVHRTRGINFSKTPLVLTKTGHFGGNPHIQHEDPVLKKTKGRDYLDWVAADHITELHPLKQEN